MRYSRRSGQASYYSQIGLAARRQPFFLFMNWMDAHEPGAIVGRPGLSVAPPSGRGVFRTYDTSLRYQDEALGQLLDGLSDRALLNNTGLRIVMPLTFDPPSLRVEGVGASVGREALQVDLVVGPKTGAAPHVPRAVCRYRSRVCARPRAGGRATVPSPHSSHTQPHRGSLTKHLRRVCARSHQVCL